MVTTIGAVMVIIFTSLAFLVYDALVRQEFHDAQAVLLAKRQFMRYVSHEVRTPLNTVVMGLQLLQQEVESLVYGDKTTTPRPVNSGEDSKQQEEVTTIKASRREERIPPDASPVIDLSNQIL